MTTTSTSSSSTPSSPLHDSYQKLTAATAVAEAAKMRCGTSGR